MNRATLVYILMLVFGVGGLWLILGAGSRLRAPTDLSGVWGVGGEDPTVLQALGETVTIEQSGRFVRLKFAKGLLIDLKLTEESLPDEDAGQLLDMIFEGPQWKLAALGEGAGGPLLFKLVGPEKHTFTVTRNVPGGDGDPRGPHDPPTQTADAATATDAP
jgi:hypothetical protein